MYTFKELAARLDSSAISSTKIKSNNPYLTIKQLSLEETDFNCETIYVGKASTLSQKQPIKSDAGFVLINDCAFDFQHFESNVIEFSEKTDVLELYQELVNVFRFKSKVDYISTSLLDFLAKGYGLNYLIKKGAEFLGNPVMLVDYTGQLQEISVKKKVNDASWMDVYKLGCISQNLYSEYKSGKCTDLVHRSSEPVFVNIDPQKYLRKIVGKVKVKNKIIGYIVVLENDREFNDGDLEIANVLIEAVGCELQKNKFYETLIGKPHEYMIIDLLKEHDIPTYLLEEWTESLYKVAPNDFYTVVIDLPKNKPEYYFLEFIRNKFEVLLHYSKSVYYKEKIILLINCAEHDYITFKDNLSDLLSENNLKAGVSFKFYSIENMKKHYNQALNALELGNLLNREDLLLEYDDFLVYDLLKQAQMKTALDNFYCPGLRELLEYDSQNNTDYSQTLHEYLQNGLNASSVAKKFHTHKNTIIYRINKISEITGMNLKSTDDCFKLYLSFLIHDLMNGHTWH